MSFFPEHFTGAVEATPLATPTRESTLAVYAVTFAAGAHTHWHTHPKGQGLYVTDGIALVHLEGQAPQHLAKGESIWIEAGQRHWHGATPGQPMTHVAYQQAANDLSTIDWQEPVTPATYAHATKENH
mgnify:CR=1 FL=1